eukprot:TRINITY_DN456_c0_g1_i1.p1 TRINITY_DN456_c0_g1~~TRINITY_DN456_c0_g1_i1.p1  ORF type:complete len:330 (-),score=72.93 TRINITY_DN456_c0_g1_i1:54-1043(-)
MKQQTTILTILLLLLLTHTKTIQVKVGHLSIQVSNTGNLPKYTFYTDDNDHYTVFLNNVYEAIENDIGDLEKIRETSVDLPGLIWNVSDVVPQVYSDEGEAEENDDDEDAERHHQGGCRHHRSRAVSRKRSVQDDDDHEVPEKQVFLSWDIVSGASGSFDSVSFMNHVKFDERTSAIKFDMKLSGYKWVRNDSALVFEYNFQRNGQEEDIYISDGIIQVGHAFFNGVSYAFDSQNNTVGVTYDVVDNKIRVIYQHFEGGDLFHDPEFGVSETQKDISHSQQQRSDNEGFQVPQVNLVVPMLISIGAAFVVVMGITILIVIMTKRNHVIV